MKYQEIKNKLYFYFDGEMDYMNILLLKDEVINILNKSKAKLVIFDLEDVSFVDSSGIGFVLARYRDLQKIGRELCLANLSKENKIIFEMSGVFQMIRLIENEVKL